MRVVPNQRLPRSLGKDKLMNLYEFIGLLFTTDNGVARDVFLEGGVIYDEGSEGIHGVPRIRYQAFYPHLNWL